MSERSQAMAYYPFDWTRAGEGIRQFTIRLAVASAHAWRRLLDDLRWEAGIDTPNVGWAAGEGEALVECFGYVATMRDALKAAGQEGSVLAVQRA